MPLVLARIDCRLIHGQVVETWVPHTSADFPDRRQRRPGREPVPALRDGAGGSPGDPHPFLSPRRGDSRLADADRNGERSILLVASAADAVTLRKAGAAFDLLNIGNLHFAAGRSRSPRPCSSRRRISTPSGGSARTGYRSSSGDAVRGGTSFDAERE